MGRIGWRANDGSGWENVPRRLYVGGGDHIDIESSQRVMHVTEADGSRVMYVGTPRQLKELRQRLEGDGL